jgi:hypothetical protein
MGAGLERARRQAPGADRAGPWRAARGGGQADCRRASVMAGVPKHRINLVILVRAQLLEATGRAQVAVELLANAFEAAQAAGTAAYLPVIVPELARLAVITERNERAAGVVAALGRIAELNPGVRSHRIAALRAEGWLDADPSALVAAAELMRCTGRALERTRLAEEAAVAISAQQGDQARSFLHEAHSAWERSGATYDLARIEASRVTVEVSAAQGIGQPAGGRRSPPLGSALPNWSASGSVTRDRRTDVHFAAQRENARLPCPSKARSLNSAGARHCRRQFAGWLFGIRPGGEGAQKTQSSAEPLARTVLDPERS